MGAVIVDIIFIPADFDKCIKPLRSISGGMIPSDDLFHDFDAIAAQITGEDRTLKSVDMLAVGKGNSLHLVEFKEITDYEYLWGKPEDAAEREFRFCTIAQEKAKLKRRELFDSLKMKAIESWVIIEESVLPDGFSLTRCESQLTFVIDNPLVVVDMANRVLTGADGDQNEGHQDLRKSIHQSLLNLRKDARPGGRPYFFDLILPMSAARFCRCLLPKLRRPERGMC